MPVFLDKSGRKIPDIVRGGKCVGAGKSTSRAKFTITAVDGRKRFDIHAYSGGPLHLEDYPLPVVVDLAGMEIEANGQGLPTPFNHDLENVVGSTESVTKIADPANSAVFIGINATGYLDQSTDDGRLVAAANTGGFHWEASIGAPVHEMEEYGPGEVVRVNGRTFSGPILVARKTTLKEISFVRRGADVGGTHVGIAARKGKRKMDFISWIRAKAGAVKKFPTGLLTVLRAAYTAETGKTPEEEEVAKVTAGDDTGPADEPDEEIEAAFSAWVAAKGGDCEGMPDEMKATLRAAFDAEQGADMDDEDKDEPPVVTAKSVKAALTKAFQRQRQAWEVEALCKDHPEIKAKAIGPNGLKKGWDMARVEQEIELKTIRASRASGPWIAIGGHDKTATIEAMQGAMILRAGGRLDSKAYGTMQAVAMGLPGWLRAGLNTDQRQRAMENAHKFSHLSLVDLCRQAIRLDGRDAPLERGEMIRAAFSGGTLPNIFTTNVNAIIVDTYMEAPSTIDGWTQATDVPDFKTNDEIQLVKDGAGMQKLPRGGEAQHTKRSDRVESYRIERFAEQQAIDEQDIIDDRLDAFKEFPVEMGLKAARLPQDLVYGILLANPTLNATGRALFNSTDANLGTTSALAASTLKAAIAAMRLIQDNGVNLNLYPSHLIVPPTLQWTAAELLQSAAIVIAGTAGAVTERGSKNVLEGTIQKIVVDARLENGVTNPQSGTAYGGSSSTWFLASNMARTIKIAYLTGTGRAPQTRTYQLDKGKYGMGWDVKMDIGGAAMDWRGLRKTTA